MIRVIRKRIIGAALLVLVTAILSACSGVLTSGQPAKQYYTLMPLAGSSATAAQGADLAIVVSAVPGLDTDRILVLGQDARLHRIANMRWPDFLPELLSSVMKRSLAGSGQFRNVTESARPEQGGWMLEIEAQEFYGIRDAAGKTHSVRVVFAGTLNCNDNEYAVSLSDSGPLSNDSTAAIVAAHQAGLDRVTLDLLNQVDAHCS